MNIVVSTIQAHKTGGYRIDAEGAAGGQLVATTLTAREGKGPDSDATTTLIAGPLATGQTPNGHGMAGVNQQHAQSNHIVAVAQNQRGELVETDYAHQLTAGGGKPGEGYAAARTPEGVRRLTPTECERLQGFPDGWTAMGADSRRYAALGNAVTVPVARWIGERLASVPTPHEGEAT